MKRKNVALLFLIVSLWAALALSPAEVTAAPAGKGKKPPSGKTLSSRKHVPSGEKKNALKQPEKVFTTVTREMLPAAIDHYIAAVEGKSRWGVMVIDVTSGDILYQRNAQEKFIPASNRKLFTGALALDQLGADFTYRTYLYRTGPVDANGILQGNLVILPQGDPTFNSELFREAHLPPDWIFRDWVEKVKAAGIRGINGELIVDCSDWDLNDLEPKGWPSRIMQDYYAPQTSPLTLNENLLQMIARPGNFGQPAIIEFTPPAEGYPIINRTVTGNKTKQLSVRRLKEGGIEVSGTIAAGSKPHPLTIPCDNPSLYAAAVFRSHLHRSGIPVSGNLRLSTRRDSLPKLSTENVLAVYISPPMAQIVTRMMKHSNNHFAEQIYVSVSAVKLRKGSYSVSKQLESEFLARLGIERSSVRGEDGSGLSELNGVTPEAICRLLLGMARHPAAASFYDSLAVGGLDGTLRGRMTSEAAMARVHAKTGYIRNVVCLSGYADSRSGRRYAFSFLVNDVREAPSVIKEVQDHLCELLCRTE
ncbi:MAG: D-alanyl-D-alanine carboxypeptidase/D-alanyl-D-alanine-endopeptidase [Candidatus Sumerlaeaceae bacterium]|nr:D-alanyl-D-alanine carboxypeptidase/D-alanyl-D-alanine-endopeptidase [Candidatus Sumerlaeaceae bacterium]